MASTNYKNFTDKELKDQGNKQFAARNFDGAIDSYTMAIMKNSNIPHYYTNRALCYLNQKRWPQAVQDARQALEKDPNLVKGHFYLGTLHITLYLYSRMNDVSYLVCNQSAKLCI